MSDPETLSYLPLNFPYGSTKSDVEAAVERLDLDALRRVRVADIVGDLSQMPGEGPEVDAIPAIVRQRVLMNSAPLWERLAELTVGEILGWEATGVTKVRVLLSFLGWEYHKQGLEPSDRFVGRAGSGDSTEILHALRSLAAWGHARGMADLMEVLESAAMSSEVDVPTGAVVAIESIDLATFAGEEYLALVDPIAAAKRVLGRFDERETAILAERVLTLGQRVTLEELGQRFGVTRERVRQLEVGVKHRMEAVVREDAHRAVRRRSEAIRQELGVACPLADIPVDIEPDDGSLADELLAWLAGPYEIDGGWLVLAGSGGVQKLVDEAFSAIADDWDTVDPQELESVLIEEGFSPERVHPAIETHPRLGPFQGRICRWPTTRAGKAKVVLHLVGRALTPEEIVDALGGEEADRSFRGALQGDEGIVRVGKERYALRQWSHDEYPGIVPAMIAEIESHGGSIEVASLAADLAERYGISPKSVQMHATMNPSFVLEEGRVRLRRQDEPYLPDVSLENDPSCFVVDGSWALRVAVDRDVLRGSGRTIPEPFAVHIGLQPGGNGELDAPERPVSVRWAQQPTMGSVRKPAQTCDVEEGDLLFIQRETPSSLGFSSSRRIEIERSTPEERLRLLVGAPARGPRTWQRVVGDALGIGGLNVPSSAYLAARLRERGNSDLAVLAETLETG